MSFFKDFGMGEDKRKWYPWVGAIVGTLCVVGTSWSVFYPLLMDKFSVDVVAPWAAGASISGLSNLIISPFLAGPLVDKKGPKVTFGISILLFLVAGACMYMLDGCTELAQGQIWWMAGSFMAGLAVGFYTGTMSATVSKWNPDNVGFAVGVDNIGPALAPVWIAPFAAAVVPSLGIGNGFAVIFGIGILGVFLFGFLPFKLPEPGWEPKDPVIHNNEGKKSMAQMANEKDMTFGQIMKTGKVWYMFILVFLACFGYMAFTMNLSTILQEGLGADASFQSVMATVSLALQIGAVVNAISRPIWGKVMDKLNSPWKTLLTIYILEALGVAFFTLVFKWNIAFAIGAIMVIYFSGGGVAPIHMATAPSLFGTKNSGKVITVTLIATGCAWVVAPYAGALARDITGTYVNTLYFTVALLIVCAILAFIQVAKAKKEEAREIDAA